MARPKGFADRHFGPGRRFDSDKGRCGREEAARQISGVKKSAMAARAEELLAGKEWSLRPAQVGSRPEHFGGVGQALSSA